MSWRKHRNLTSGEMEFHLAGEPAQTPHDVDWTLRRLSKLRARHARHAHAAAA